MTRIHAQVEVVQETADAVSETTYILLSGDTYEELFAKILEQMKVSCGNHPPFAVTIIASQEPSNAPA
jgi:hypothetical protein